MSHDKNTEPLDPQIAALLDAAMNKPSADAADTAAPKNGGKGNAQAKPAADTHQTASSDEAAADDSALKPTLADFIRTHADETDSRPNATLTLRKVLGGDIFDTTTVRNQIWLLLLIAAFIIMYISNRYRCQQSLIRISQLKTELNDAKYRALSSNSMLTEKSRESHVLDMLKNCKDSTLHIATQPPYIINVPDDYEQ